MKTLRVGIASYEAMKARSMAIARGELKPRTDEPRVWFTSLESFARVFSTHNQALLKLIAREQPESLSALEALSGRAKSNLSRSLKTLARYGLVELEKGARGSIKPRVPFGRIQLDVRLKDGGTGGRPAA